MRGGSKVFIGLIALLFCFAGLLYFRSKRAHDSEIAQLWRKGTDLNIKDTTAGSVKPGLLRLKSIGWNPTRVLDVGANVGDWSRVVKDVYPDAEVFMIEGSETCAQDLMTTGNAFVISLVGKEDSTIEFYESKKGTGNSIYKEKTKYFSSVLPTIKPIYTLDTLTAHLPPVEMLKLDIQGAELAALMGAHRVLQTVEVILLEISLVTYNEGAPPALDTLSYLNSIGYDLLDILDFNSLAERLGQADVVVVKRGSPLFTHKMDKINGKLAITSSR